MQRMNYERAYSPKTISTTTIKHTPVHIIRVYTMQRKYYEWMRLLAPPCLKAYRQHTNSIMYLPSYQPKP